MQRSLGIFQRYNSVLDAAVEGRVVGASWVDVCPASQAYGGGMFSVLGVVMGTVNVAASVRIRGDVAWGEG